MNLTDVFNNDAFSAVSLTNAVNDIDTLPSMLTDLNLFNLKPINTTTVAIEKKGTALSLVQTGQRGSAPEQRIRDKRTLRNLNVPHLAKEAVVYADQVQSVRAFGTEGELETVQTVVNGEVAAVNSDIDLTLENLRLGAVKGVITDADGSVIYDLFDEFDVTQLAEFDFALGTATTDVRKKMMQLYRLMSKEVKMGGLGFQVHALCSHEFFDDLISHASTKQAWERWNAGQQLRENYAYQSFGWGNFMFHDYQGTDDDTSVAVATDKAHFFPVGVPNLFQEAYAPADTMEFVNTLGLPRYAIPAMDPSGKGKFMSVEVQANPLPFCTKPRTLIQAKRA